MQSEDGDLSNLTEIYTYLKSHPLNLNRAKKEELLEMQLLTDIQINNLINYKNTKNKLL